MCCGVCYSLALGLKVGSTSCLLTPLDLSLIFTPGTAAQPVLILALDYTWLLYAQGLKAGSCDEIEVKAV